MRSLSFLPRFYRGVAGDAAAGAINEYRHRHHRHDRRAAGPNWAFPERNGA